MLFIFHLAHNYREPGLWQCAIWNSLACSSIMRMRASDTRSFLESLRLQMILTVRNTSYHCTTLQPNYPNHINWSRIRLPALNSIYWVRQKTRSIRYTFYTRVSNGFAEHIKNLQQIYVVFNTEDVIISFMEYPIYLYSRFYFIDIKQNLKIHHTINILLLNIPEKNQTSFSMLFFC